MTTMVIIEATIGGVLIGFAAVALLLLNGRISGISGIFSGALAGSVDDRSWRLFFVAGLLAGGGLLWMLKPDMLPFEFQVRGSGWTVLILGGALVGFGTRLGSGCTSGHGVCGVSRLSPRSLVATSTFMIFGIASVYVVRGLLGW